MLLKFNKILLVTILFFGTLTRGYNFWFEDSQPCFPKNFHWGVACSRFQDEGEIGCPNSNWTYWQKKVNLQKSGSSCGWRDTYKEDIQLLKELGCNSIRFSIEWSEIEKTPGVFDQDEIQHYKDVCIELVKHGIKPMLTLHHFTQPQWFSEIGGFEKKENIDLFLRYSKKMFSELSDVVKLWCTINEPTVYVLCGYLMGKFPPGKILAYALGVDVLKNLFIAHNEIYKSLKNMPNGLSCEIGLVHQYLKFDPYRNYNPIDLVTCKFFNSIMYDLPNEFLLENKVVSYSDITVKKTKLELRESKIADFIGLNYYSRVLVNSFYSKDGSFVRESDVKTDMPYCIYGEGIYHAIKDLSLIGLPIYITENGIADKLDINRDRFIREYLGYVNKAIREGIDVRGFYYWSFKDNYEWDSGFNMKFGLYEVNFETKSRSLRAGSKAYQEIITQWKNEILEK